MTKYIKFIMKDGKQFTLPIDRAEKLINSTQTLVKLTNEKGFWTGNMINKSEISKTEPDFEREKEERLKLSVSTQETELTSEQQKRKNEKWAELRKDVEAMGLIKKIK